jgi:acetolactate synthase-1/3 small subunit
MRHTLSVIVANSPGVLSRVSGLFARRGYNIESLTVSATHRSDISRMTIVVEGDPTVLEQMVKQLNKQIDVIKVWDITDTALSRELALIKVAAGADKRSQVLEICRIYRASIVDLSPDYIILQITGASGKLDALEEVLDPYGIVELVRTGSVAMERGANRRMLI